MIDLQFIRNFYPPQISQNARFQPLILKEYIQMLILDHIASSKYSPKLTFIGGTCLRHVYGIDRFSEDIDFDCKNLSEADFNEMTDSVVTYLSRNGINAVIRDKQNEKLKAFRRNIYFPEMLFDLNLSGHRDERLPVKIEAQNQGVEYKAKSSLINKLGFSFIVRCAPADILCSMKIAALLGRSKGRDFYDLIFLSSFARPNYDYLSTKCGIHNGEELATALSSVAEATNLKDKSRDFIHLAINDRSTDKILLFADIIPHLASD